MDLVDRILARYGGVASRANFLNSGISRHTIDNLVRRGELAVPFPRSYCRAWDVDQLEILERAALTSVGPPATLSHVSALRRWGLIASHGLPVHVTVLAHRMPRGHPDLVIHRVQSFPPVVRLAGLITVSAAHAVATSWPLADGSEQRAPAISAVRQRLISTTDLATEVDKLARLPGRRQLVELTRALSAGCESELELWGFLAVFDHPGLRQGTRQRTLVVRGRRYRLDLAYEAEKVAVELDGRAYHSSPDARERDMRRDAALASIGWITMRLSYRRMHDDVDGCRRDVLAVLARRR